ncbi:MAG: hypothetical protein NTW93_06835 [Phycisphaerae bacterium]|nr:hypothetical protein [Phycisphaerae bacterium]
MNKTSLLRQAIGGLFFLFLCSIFLAGCAAQKRSCPPLATADEATAVLKEYSANLKPLKATGNCMLSYTNEKGEKFAQSFPVRIWFQTSRKFCLYGDVMFDPRGVCFAVTGNEYWTYAKPFGMYIKGQINTAADDYFSNPLVLVDFLEPVSADCNSLYMADSADAILLHKVTKEPAMADKSEKVRLGMPYGSCNILVCRDSGLCKAKKIFIDCCGHFVKKVEYLNCSGNLVLTAELDEYKTVAQAGFSFPHKLVYRHFDGQNRSNLMQIKLDSVKLWQANPEQLKALFSPPDANNIKKEAK